MIGNTSKSQHPNECSAGKKTSGIFSEDVATGTSHSVSFEQEAQRRRRRRDYRKQAASANKLGWKLVCNVEIFTVDASNNNNNNKKNKNKNNNDNKTTCRQPVRCAIWCN